MIYGFCLGGGLEIAPLACDLRYCAASAQFGIPAAKLGLAYNVEGHKRLLETVGHARAREIMFLGRRYNAEEALAMGLVHRVVPDLESVTEQILADLGERAAFDPELQNDHRGVREVLRRAGSCAHAGGDRALREERRLCGRAARVHGEAQAAVQGQMKIRTIKTRGVAAPMKRPLATSIATISIAPLLLIDLETDAGIVGRSYLFGPGKHHLSPIAELVKAMAAMVEGDEVAPFDLEKAPRPLCAPRRAQHRALRHVGHRHGGVGRFRAVARPAARAAARRRAARGARLQLQGTGPPSSGQAGKRSGRACRRRLSGDQAAARKAFGRRRI